jgi:glycine betaine/proline transport system permease protein
MTAVSLPAIRRFDPRAARRYGLVGLLVVAILLFVIFRNTSQLPLDQSNPLFLAINEVRDWIRDNRFTNPALGVLSLIKEPVSWLTESIIGLIAYVGWLGVVGVGAAFGWLVGGWRYALLAISGSVVLGALGLWELSMATLGLTISAVIISLVFGVPLGILAARNDRFQQLITPVLDVMQIMPTFAYLAPMSLLFGIGGGASAIATLIYAMPAAIRITALGIRRVPAATVEASESLGATGLQTLFKVQLPLARRVIGLAINQTIMLALGMVVITVLIDAPGLGEPIIRGLERGNVGVAFEAGLAIVVLAILLDRLTERASAALDPRESIKGVRAETRRMILRFGVAPGSTDPAAIARRRRWRRVIIGAAAAIVVFASLQIPAEFPDVIGLSLAGPINDIVGWIKTNLFWLTDGFRTVFTNGFLNPFEGILTSSPWWLVVIAVFGLSTVISGIRPAIVATVCLLLIAISGVWEDSMVTLASVLIATGLTLIVGLILGILSARSNRVSTALRPLLDFAQTMPSFVYLLPAVALFGPSRLTAIIAALIYAVPPVIRLVEAGLRSVSPTIVEAATASGATERQLLFKVRLPVSAPALLLAANQGIIMVLAMVVVGALVGAGALGHRVIQGFSQGEDFGKGLVAAIAIVLLGIMLDRITQGAGTRRPRLHRAAG